MQNEMNNLNLINLQENVLLKNASLRQHRAAHDILGQAQYHAKKMVNQANQQVESIRQEAYRTGYEEGVLLAVAASVQFIDDRQQLVNNVYLQLRDELKALLSETVNQESLIVMLFEHWAEGLDKKDDGTPFHLLLPQASRRFKPKLKAALHAIHQASAVFEFHHDSRYVFKYREQLVEFSPDIFVESQVENLLQSKDLASGCARVSAQAREKLHQLIEQHYPRNEQGMPEDHINGEIDDDDHH